MAMADSSCGYMLAKIVSILHNSSTNPPKQSMDVRKVYNKTLSLEFTEKRVTGIFLKNATFQMAGLCNEAEQD
jgi:hypothetical protein